MQWLGDRSQMRRVLSSLTVAHSGRWGWVAKPHTSPSIWPWIPKTEHTFYCSTHSDKWPQGRTYGLFHCSTLFPKDLQCNDHHYMVVWESKILGINSTMQLNWILTVKKFLILTDEIIPLFFWVLEKVIKETKEKAAIKGLTKEIWLWFMNTYSTYLATWTMTSLKEGVVNSDITDVISKVCYWAAFLKTTALPRSGLPTLGEWAWLNYHIQAHTTPVFIMEFLFF